MEKEDVELLRNISSSMFHRNLISMTQGSISIKKTVDTFIINKKNALLNNITQSSLIELNISSHFLWKLANIEVSIHAAIYSNILSAKYVACIRSESIIAYTLNHSEIIPVDYIGTIYNKKIPIYDPKIFSDWGSRAPTEITKYMQKTGSTVVILKGIGMYACNRDIDSLVKEVDIIDSSCKILLASKSIL
jgi:L-fuculose-phosphate aldolase